MHYKQNMKIATKKEKHSEIFVSIVILTLIALAVPIAAGGWTSDAPITVDTVVKKEGTGSIKVTSNQSVGWINDSSIESGLSPALWLVAPEVFEKDSVWYLITTNYTDFYGYNWTGSTWQSDSGIISGLYSFGDIFATAVFYKDSTWYLIADNYTGYCYGYNWTGSAWQNDSAIASGLGTISGNYPAIDVFHKDGTWYLIAGNDAGTFTGYNWSGTTWQSDSGIVSGLGDIGSYGNPSVFYKDSKWYLIAGENAGNFLGFNWSGSTWVSDSDITEGLYDIGSCPYPNVFMGGVDFGDETWYLLAVEEGNGYWRGFNWRIYTPTCYFQNDFSPPISVTNVSKNTGYLALWYFIYDASKINSNVKISIYTDDSNYMYWEVSKMYFENNWSEVYLPMSEGTEVGTLSLSSISKFKLEIPGTEDPDMVHRVDYMRFVEYPYTLHNIYLEPEDEGGVGTYYPPPHLVEFRVQTWQGVPFADVNVTAKSYSTTMGTWVWLYSIFGYKSETQVHNVTMSDTTDSNGAISFLMVETIKYEMTFIKGSEVNETIYLYPKEDHYKIIIGTHWVETASMWDVVNYSILVGELNDTHAYINFSYVDGNNKTSELYYFINQSNGTTSFNIYNHTYTGGDCANITNDYVVKRGEAYLIGFEADNADYGEIKHSLFIRIFEKDKRLLEFEDVPDYMYTYISVGLLCLVGAFFGMVTVPEGGIVICLEGWILWFVGWFLWQNPLAPLYLTTATVFAVLIIYAAKGRSKGVS